MVETPMDDVDAAALAEQQRKAAAVYAAVEADAIARGPILRWVRPDPTGYGHIWQADAGLACLQVRAKLPGLYSMLVILDKNGRVIAAHDYRGGDVVNAFAICEELLRMNALQLIGPELYYAPR